MSAYTTRYPWLPQRPRTSATGTQWSGSIAVEEPALEFMERAQPAQRLVGDGAPVLLRHLRQISAVVGDAHSAHTDPPGRSSAIRGTRAGASRRKNARHPGREARLHAVLAVESFPFCMN